MKATPTGAVLLMMLFAFVNIIWMHARLLDDETDQEESHVGPDTQHSSRPRTTSTFSTASLLCPHRNSTICVLRHQELNDQLQVEAEIRKELIDEQDQKRKRDVYNRTNPQGVQEWLDAQARIVQQVLADYPNPKFQPLPQWAHHEQRSLPDIHILGFQKAGTSQLYKLLASHPRTVGLRGKEFCVDGSRRLEYDYDNENRNGNAGSDETRVEWHRKLFHWHQMVYHKRQQTLMESRSQKKILNGCLQLDELEYRLRYIRPPSLLSYSANTTVNNKKYILILRDPADWMWAVVHYWYDYHLDTDSPDEHDWLSPNLHYRSPELFHELVLSGEKLKSAYKKFHTFRQRSVLVTRRIQNLVGKENLILLRNEDLIPERIATSGLLQRLSVELGLEVDGFQREVVFSRTNCNAVKGIAKSCSNHKNNGNSTHPQPQGAYPVTRHRTMLATTREILYLQWQQECEIWAEEFGVVYPECLRARSKTKA